MVVWIMPHPINELLGQSSLFEWSVKKICETVWIEMAMAMASEAAASNLDEDEPLVTILPQDVIDALAELDLELSEGKTLPSCKNPITSAVKNNRELRNRKP